MKLSTVSIGEFDKSDSEAISEIICEKLQEMDQPFTSFSYSIEVDVVDEDADAEPCDNTLRAKLAQEAIDGFASNVGLSGEDNEAKVGDLLCNIMHLCHQHDLDFQALIDRGHSHFHAEIMEESGNE